MPVMVDFDTGSDLEDFIKGSDESDSEPEVSESEAEYESSDEEATNRARGVRVTRKVRHARLFVESSEEEDSDADVTANDANEDNGESEQQDEGDDSEVDDHNPDVPTPVTTIKVRRRPTVAVHPSSVAPLALTCTPAWYKAVTNRHFSTDSGVRPFAEAKVEGRPWVPTPGQRVRVGHVKGDYAFYAGKEGVVLGPSQSRPGKWRVTVHGSGLETALHGETGVAFHSSVLTPITNLKLHLNTVLTAELPVLGLLVQSVTPAMVRTIQRGRPFENWPDLRTRVPTMTDVTAALLKDLCAVNTSESNTTWRAFAALDGDYAAQLTTWSRMSVDERLDARDNASEVIEAEKAERRRERMRTASSPPEGEPRARRPRRAAAVAADAIGYREEDAWRLRMLEANAWIAMQND